MVLLETEAQHGMMCRSVLYIYLYIYVCVCTRSLVWEAAGQFMRSSERVWSYGWIGGRVVVLLMENVSDCKLLH